MFSEDKNNIALIIKNKPDWQKGLLNGIGGKIEEKDFYPFNNKAIKDTYENSSHTAMCREFLEEAGLITFPKDWNLFLTMKSDNGNSNADSTNGKTQQYDECWQVDFYRSFSDNVFNCKTMEDEQVVIISVENALCSNTIDNLKWIILLALDKNPKFTLSNY